MGYLPDLGKLRYFAPNQIASGMCEFAGNRHKQFNTNYLYVQSGYCVCMRFLSRSLARFACVLKSRFAKENNGQPKWPDV